MHRLFALIVLLSLLLLQLPHVLALQVTPNSPCAAACIDKDGTDLSDPNTSSTKPADITCEDRQYGSAAGQKWQKCMSCLQNSTWSQGSESDQQWFLYNERYSVNSCIFNHYNQSGISVGPCATSRACGALEQALKFDGMAVNGNSAEYGYCDADGGAMTGGLFGQCLSCVKTGGDKIFLANAIVALEAGCLQRPARGSGAILGLSASVFSKTVVAIVDPATLNKSQNGGSSGPSTVVIAVAVVVTMLVLIIAAAVGFICYRRRKNRIARSPAVGSKGGIFNNHHRPTSSLSFRCQDYNDPQVPRYQPNEPDIAETTWDPESQRPGITSTKRTSFTGTMAPVYLNPLSTQMPRQPAPTHQSPSAGIHSSPKTPGSGLSPSSATTLLPHNSYQPYVPQQYGIAMPLTGGEQANGHYTTGATATKPASPVSNKKLQDIWADAMAVQASPIATKAHNDIWADALANQQRSNRNVGNGLYRPPSTNSASTGQPVSAVSLLRNNDRWADAIATQQMPAYSAAPTKKAQDVYSAGVWRPGQDVVPQQDGGRKKKSRDSSNSPIETKNVRVEFPPPPPRK